jgi:hypothetical protein
MAGSGAFSLARRGCWLPQYANLGRAVLCPRVEGRSKSLRPFLFGALSSEQETELDLRPARASFGRLEQWRCPRGMGMCWHFQSRPAIKRDAWEQPHCESGARFSWPDAKKSRRLGGSRPRRGVFLCSSSGFRIARPAHEEHDEEQRHEDDESDNAE